MANRRARIQAFYQNPQLTRGLLLEKTAASAAQYQFRGPSLSHSVVVRCDLNGYSSWARDNGISARVELLDNFFSKVVPLLSSHRGIFFRDEGDCIVSVFSDYFQLGATEADIESFCKAVVSQTYGSEELSAKAVVACGELAYFQKAHEVGSEDWSAEGAPFVTAARLEHAISSGQHIAFLKSEYDDAFAPTANTASYGQRYFWTVENEKLQVPGLGLSGGWTDIVRLQYVHGGRVQK